MKKFFLLILLSMTIVLNINAVKKILVWMPDDEDYRKVYRPIFTSFEKKNNVKIDIETFTLLELRSNTIAEVKKGSGPDIFFGINDWLGNLYDEKTIASPDDFIDTAKIKNSLTANSVNASTINNKLYMIPVSMSGLVLMYNSRILKKPPETDKEMIDLAIQHTDKLKYIYGLGSDYRSSYYAVPFILGYGGKILNPDKTIDLDSPETIKGCRAIYDMVYKYNCTTPLMTRDSLLEMFLDEKISMLICGTWELKKIIDSGKTSIVKAALLPKVESTGLRIRPLVEFKGFMMTSSARNKKESAKLLEFISQREQQVFFAKTTYQIPTIKNYMETITDESAHYYDVFEKQFEIGYPMPKDLEMKYFWATLSPFIKKTLKGESFDETGMRQSVLDFNAKILKSKTK